MISLTTLCYIEKDGRVLMLHRDRKKNDINRDKWIGVGGHFEDRESPDDCLLREVREETGLTLTSFFLRGIVTFISGDMTEYMVLYTADEFEGELIPCNEGELEWVESSKIMDLDLWEGDRIFLKLLMETDDIFSLKLTYEGDDLTGAVLNGRELSKNDGLWSGYFQA